MEDIQKAFASGRYRAIVLDKDKEERWMQPGLDRAYRLFGPILPADGLWTRTGYHTKPRWLYEPRDPNGKSASR